MEESTLSHTFPTLTTLRKKPLENIVGKGENAGNQHLFSPFPQCFFTFPTGISTSESHLFCRLQILLIWINLKFCCLVKLINCLILTDIFLTEQTLATFIGPTFINPRQTFWRQKRDICITISVTVFFPPQNVTMKRDEHKQMGPKKP